MSAVVMLVDDEEELRSTVASLIETFGYAVQEAGSGEEALELYPDAKPALVLMDQRMPGLDGLQTLERLKELDPSCRVVIMSAFQDSETIVKVMKLGAENYLSKPVPAEELRVVIERLIGESEQLTLKERLEGVIGQSEAMGRVFHLVSRVAATQATVLIRGESGTGKEVIARAIHQLGSAPQKAFVTLDCTNIPANLMESELFGHEKGAFTDARARKDGLLETADGGTLFLDEIGLMPLDMQAKLLNVLETQRFRRVGGNEEITVEVRILAATNEDLEQAVQERRFREDLYYRLNVVPVDLPPLRERDDDVLLIVDHYLKWYTSLHGIPTRVLGEDALALMRAYPWPGNVRELRNVIERAVLMSDGRVIPAAALSIDRRSRRESAHDPRLLSIDPQGRLSVNFPPEGLSLEGVERQLIEAALEQTQGNITRASTLLHLSRDTLRYRISKFKLE